MSHERWRSTRLLAWRRQGNRLDELRQEDQIRRGMTVRTGDVADPVSLPFECEVTDIITLSMPSFPLSLQAAIWTDELGCRPGRQPCGSDAFSANTRPVQRIIGQLVGFKTHLANWFAVHSGIVVGHIEPREREVEDRIRG